MNRAFAALMNIAINLTLLSAAMIWFVFKSPLSPLPNAYNPYGPFDVSDPVTFATRFKLDPVVADEALCQDALTALNVSFEKRDDFLNENACGIPQRTFLTNLNGVDIGPVETQCHIALRMALWSRDLVVPTAVELFGEPVAKIETQGSYNCRTMRTDAGSGEMLSEHATANAIDVKGVTLSSGETVFLEDDWGSDTPKGVFLRDLRNGGCRIFQATLGPDFNLAHADHFHFDNGRFRVCR